MKKWLFITLILACTSCSQVEERAENELFLNTSPRKPLILDVDFSTDVDDVCAVRIATALDDQGVIDLKCVGYSVRGKNNLQAMRGMLLHDGKSDIPIGRSSVDIPDTSPYWDLMTKYDDGKGEVMDAVSLYRKILAESKRRVDIITTGYVTNIELLLKSEADEYSPLSGEELIKQKCGQLYIVGGVYPEGYDNNFFFAKPARAAIDYVNRNWPFPIVYFLAQVGGPMICGAGLQAIDRENKDIVSQALTAFGTSTGRYAWDPYGVWCAAYTCGEVTQTGLRRADLEIRVSDGYNIFHDNPSGRHYINYRLCDDDKYYNSTMYSIVISKAKLH
jgi:hypothetical protein